MRRLRISLLTLSLAAGCAHAPAVVSPALSAQASAPVPMPAVTSSAPGQPAPITPAAPGDASATAPGTKASATPAQPAPAAVEATPSDVESVPEVADAVVPPNEQEPEEIDDDDDDSTPSADEGESHDVVQPDGPVPFVYTKDLSDEQLAELWKKSPEALGSISMGFVDEGRIINGEQFPKGDGVQWLVVTPERTYGTHETIEYILTAIRKVREQYPEAPPLRVNQISAKDGGYLRPHKSHQSGRDADLAFYYPTVEPIRVREREKYIDVPKNWALIKALITLTDVQFILVDRRVQKVLYDYALAHGEDPAWLDTLFHSAHPMLMHARHHRDHFHVRFYNGRAQELGRRVAPLLAQRPEQNLLMHRVHQGDTLGHIALKYGSSIEALRKANHIKGSMLHIAQVLKVPLRGPCTHCPIPPPVIVPARHLPPGFEPEAPATNVAAAPAPTTPAATAAVVPAVATAAMSGSMSTVPAAALVPASTTPAASATVPAMAATAPAAAGTAGVSSTVAGNGATAPSATGGSAASPPSNVAAAATGTRAPATTAAEAVSAAASSPSTASPATTRASAASASATPDAHPPVTSAAPTTGGTTSPSTTSPSTAGRSEPATNVATTTGGAPTSAVVPAGATSAAENSAPAGVTPAPAPAAKNAPSAPSDVTRTPATTSAPSTLAAPLVPGSAKGGAGGSTVDAAP